MNTANCSIIDDIDASLAGLSELGRRILSGPTHAMQAEVHRFAERFKWEIVSHGSFKKWAQQEMQKTAVEWIVLDPLSKALEVSARVHHVRTSRQFDSSILPLHIDGSDFMQPYPDKRMGVLDDAGSSGRTLTSVVATVRKWNRELSDVILCASSRAARDRVAEVSGRARWSVFVPGDWRVIHLRDGCPFLPFAGRPTAQATLRLLDGTSVELRCSSAYNDMNLWRTLSTVRTIGEEVLAAQRAVIGGLTSILGRRPTVDDVKLLGTDVTLSVMPNKSVYPNMTLEDACLANT